jgi:hypothetical protein
MKHALIVLTGLLSYLLLTTSCEKTPYYHIKPIESSIYNEIKAHREANGETKELVMRPEMFVEAQLFSIQMATNQKVDTTGISVHWDEIHAMFGGTNEGLLLSSTNLSTPADIVAGWTADSATNALLLEDYTQCGVGVEQDVNGLNYITVMLMLYEN